MGLVEVVRDPTANLGPRIIWEPNAGPQTLFCATGLREILFGGQAGGGKSDGLIGKWVGNAYRYGSAHRGVIFRKSFPQLEEIERRCLELFTPIWGDQCYKVGRKTFELETANGTATLQLRALEEEKDVYKHIGHQFNYIGWDELTMWPSDWWFEYLLTRLRSPEGTPCQMVATSNPGGAGHNWVKQRFMFNAEGRRVPPLTPIPIPKMSGEDAYRIYIPSRLEDNPKLLENDPYYRQQLDAIADPMMRRAYAEGDWDIIAGNAFPEFRRDIHVIPNRPLEPHRGRIWRAMDWGEYRPYAVLWFQEDDDALIVKHMLYGKGPKPNIGTGEPPSVVWEKIQDVERSYGVIVNEGWADPQCWMDRPGTLEVISFMGGAAAGWKKWAKGPDSRINQKRVVHEFLKVVNGRSKLYICERCEPLVACMETIPRDIRNPEDVDTDAEDHSYDALRGGLSKSGLTRHFNDGISTFAKSIREFNEGVRLN